MIAYCPQLRLYYPECATSGRRKESMNIKSSGRSIKFNRDLFRFESYFDEGESDGNEGDDGDEQESEGSSGTEQESNVGDPDKKRLSDEAAKYRVQAREERKLREQLEAKVKEFEDGDKTETEKLRSELESLTKDASSLRSSNVQLTMQNAVLRSASKFNFKNVDDAMKLAINGSDIQGDEDDLEDLVKDALEKLAKDKPYLLASETDDNEPNSDSSKNEPSGRETNGKKKKKDGLDEEALYKKFPALQR